jgi:hypothetical protein
VAPSETKKHFFTTIFHSPMQEDTVFLGANGYLTCLGLEKGNVVRNVVT